MSIQRDLAIGHMGERRFIQIYEEAGMPTQQHESQGQFKPYDLISEHPMGFKLTTEVKYDIYALRTNNAALEVYNPEKCEPTGLWATEADLWGHLTDHAFLANVKTLKQWVEDNPPDRIITAAGDGNASLFIYHCDKLFQPDGPFVQIDNLRGDELFAVITSVCFQELNHGIEHSQGQCS